MTHTILHIDSSAREDGSVSRDLSAQIVASLQSAGSETAVMRRDLRDGLPFVNAGWIQGNFTPADVRTDADKAALAQSDALVEELKSADTVVIGLPVYNFSIPATLKSWIDMIARVGLTFNYTESGPVGCLTGKKVIVTYASGGVPLGSPMDHATPYLKTVLGFVGVTDVVFFDSDSIANFNPARQIEAAA